MISADELREKQFKDYEKEIAQEQQIIKISDELITDPHFLSEVDALVEKRLDKQVTDAMAWRKSFIRVDNLGLECVYRTFFDSYVLIDDYKTGRVLNKYLSQALKKLKIDSPRDWLKHDVMLKPLIRTELFEKINADVIAHWKIKLRNKGYVVKPSTEIEWR